MPIFEHYIGHLLTVPLQGACMPYSIHAKRTNILKISDVLNRS
jgi:hypothetical protein